MPTPPRPHDLPDASSRPGRAAPAMVRIRGPQDLAVAVPHLIGFHPESSLVVVATSGPGPHQVCVTMRVDLPPDPVGEPDLVRFTAPLRQALRHAGAERAHLLVYPELAADPALHSWELPRRGLVEGVCEQLDRAGVDVGEVLCVLPTGEGEDRFWSYLCAGAGCCPPQGRVTEAVVATRIGFGFVSHGRAALPSRAAVVESLSPVLDAQSVQLQAAVRDLQLDVTAAVGTDPAGSGERARRRWRADLARRTDDMLANAAATVPPRPLVVAEQALLLAALSQVCVRDLVLAAAARRDELVAVVELLTPVVRRAPAGAVAPVATGLALCAYLLGDGALSWVALDRATDDDPDYSLAELLSASLAAGLGPGRMWEAMTSLPAVGGWDGTTPRPARRGALQRGGGSAQQGTAGPADTKVTRLREGGG